MAKNELNANEVVPSFEELCNQYDNDPVHTHTIKLIKAILQWMNKPSQTEEVREKSLEDIFQDDPFRRKTPRNQGAEMESISQTSLLTEVMELAVSAFLLHPTGALEEWKKIVRQGMEFAKLLKEPMEQHISLLQPTVLELRGLTETIERLETELTGLRKTEKERKQQIESKENELRILRNRIQAQEEKTNSIDRERDVLNDKLRNLDEEEKELTQKKVRIDLRKKEHERLAKEYASQEAELLKQQDEERDKKATIEQRKRKLIHTKEAVKKLDRHPFLDPKTTEHVQKIWQSFLEDKLDKEIGDTKN